MNESRRNDIIKMHPWAKYIMHLERPFADSAEINRNLIDQIFRGECHNGQWFSKDEYPGGLAGAIRRQLSKGEHVGGEDHLAKGIQRIRQIDKMLIRHRNGRTIITERDEKILKEIRRDLVEASNALVDRYGRGKFHSASFLVSRLEEDEYWVFYSNLSPIEWWISILSMDEKDSNL